MITSMIAMLQAAEAGEYALGAFNVYNLEGVKAVLAAAEAEASPVILQLHPSALKYGGSGLIALCLEAAQNSTAQAAVHLDHSSAEADIRMALECGFGSIMVDGSHLPYAENLEFTQKMSQLAHSQGARVEAELGRLAGSEDGLSVPEYQARLTDPEQAVEFVRETGIDSLAVCIGNVHGHYRRPPVLDFVRLAEIHRLVPVPLVLHGASGLPDHMIQKGIELGVRKINVNTEIRDAYLRSLRINLAADPPPDLIQLMQNAIEAMQAVVITKIRSFGSNQKNPL